MAHSDAPHISMETAIAAEETQLASVEDVRRASVELQRACQDIVREADREKEDTREKEHALQDSLAYIAIEPYRERLGDNRRGALVLGYRHSARLGRDVKVVAAEKSDYCKLAEASSEEEKRNILKRLDSSEDERNAEQAAWTEWKSRRSNSRRHWRGGGGTIGRHPIGTSGRHPIETRGRHRNPTDIS